MLCAIVFVYNIRLNSGVTFKAKYRVGYAYSVNIAKCKPIIIIIVTYDIYSVPTVEKNIKCLGNLFAENFRNFFKISGTLHILGEFLQQTFKNFQQFFFKHSANFGNFL